MFLKTPTGFGAKSDVVHSGMWFAPTISARGDSSCDCMVRLRTPILLTPRSFPKAQDIHSPPSLQNAAESSLSRHQVSLFRTRSTLPILLFRFLPIVLSLMVLHSSMEAQVYNIVSIAGLPHILEGQFRTSIFMDADTAIASDPSGNLFFTDHAQIFKIDTLGVVHVFAGTGQEGFAGDNGPALQAVLSYPGALTFDRNGNLFFVDSFRIRSIARDGTITTVAGNGIAQSSGDGGDALSAGIMPGSLAVGSTGDIYFVDHETTIRKIHNGAISTIAGSTFSNNALGDGGPALAAVFSFISSIAINQDDELFLSDADNYRIRVIDNQGIVHTIAGNGSSATPSGTGGPALTAAIGYVNSIAIHQQVLYTIGGSRVSAIDLAAGSLRTIASDVQLASGHGLTITPGGDLFILCEYGITRLPANQTPAPFAGSQPPNNINALDTVFGSIKSISRSPDGDIYVLDDTGLRVIIPGGETRTVTLGGLIPTAIAAAADGTLFVASGGAIYSISSVGTMTSVAGDGHYGSSGDGGPALKAEFGVVPSLIVMSDTLMFVDTASNSVRAVTLSTGTIHTVAGNGQISYSGDGGPALSAGMAPESLAGDSAGAVYIVDGTCNCVRKVAPSGSIVTIAGNVQPGFGGDGGPAIMASLNAPVGIYVDAGGALFIGDAGNSRVREVTPDGLIRTIAGTGVGSPAGGSGGPANLAQLLPELIIGDGQGGLYVTDSFNGRIWRMTPFPNVALTLIPVTDTTAPLTPNSTINLVIKAMDPSGMPLAGIAVSFAVIAGDIALSTDSATTKDDGTASTVARLGPDVGHAQIEALAQLASSAIFLLTSVTTPPPTIFADGVVGAGLSSPAVVALSPNAIVSIFGYNFAPAGTARETTSADLTDGALPTMLAGVCVQIGGEAVPILYVSATQVNAQVPLVLPGNIGIDVVAQCGTNQEAGSNSVIEKSQPATPEFFYSGWGSDGTGYIAAYDATTGLSVGPISLGKAFLPAKPGDSLELFFTGGGVTVPPIQPGAFANEAAPVAGAASITLDGATLPTSAVLYVGAAPGFAGLFQANVVVPEDVSSGDHKVQIVIDGVGSPLTGSISIAK